MIIHDLEYLEVIPNSEVSGSLLGGRRTARTASRSFQFTEVLAYKTDTLLGPGAATTTGGVKATAIGSSYAFATAGVAGGISVFPIFAFTTVAGGIAFAK